MRRYMSYMAHAIFLAGGSMTTSSDKPISMAAKRDAMLQVIREVRPHAIDLEVTAELVTVVKAPPGFGWSKTCDAKIAIHNATKHVHIVVLPGSTSDTYFYK